MYLGIITIFLLFSPYLSILSNSLITVATLTTDGVENVKPFEVFIENTPETGLDYLSKVLVGYSFTVYKELRLIEKLGGVSEEIMNQVKVVLGITFSSEA